MQRILTEWRKYLIEQAPAAPPAAGAAATAVAPAAGGVVGPPGMKLTPEQTKKLIAMKEEALEKVKDYAVYIASKIKGRDPKQTEKLLLDKFANLEKKMGTWIAVQAAKKIARLHARSRDADSAAARGGGAAAAGAGKTGAQLFGKGAKCPN